MSGSQRYLSATCRGGVLVAAHVTFIPTRLPVHHNSTLTSPPPTPNVACAVRGCLHMLAHATVHHFSAVQTVCVSLSPTVRGHARFRGAFSFLPNCGAPCPRGGIVTASGWTAVDTAGASKERRGPLGLVSLAGTLGYLAVWLLGRIWLGFSETLRAGFVFFAGSGLLCAPRPSVESRVPG